MSDWNKWAAIGQLAGAAASFAAVVTSLYLAKRAEKPKLILRAGQRIILSPGATGPAPEVIDITIRNAGVLTAHISQFGWRAGRWPFKRPLWAIRQVAIQLPGDMGLGTHTPFELPPGQRRTMIINQENFMSWLAEKKGEPFFARQWPLLGLRRTPIWVVAHLENGLTIRSRVERELAEALYQAERRTSTLSER